MMRKPIVVALLLVLATAAFAHAGHHHKYLGTITAVHDDAVTIRTTDGHDVSFALATTTSIKRGDADATRAELTSGTRVSVELGNDGKTAVVVKLGAK